MATKDREPEIIERFFKSLETQVHKDFELIVVDQNKGDDIKKLSDKYHNKFRLRYIFSEKGLSKARNKGLNYIDGDIVGFPDDDCWYDSNLLKEVSNFFETKKNYSILTGRSIDENKQESAGKFQEYSSDINKNNIWNVAISFSIFIRFKDIKSNSIIFDENLGVGACTIYGSGEETDFLLKLIEIGSKGYYNYELKVFHPNPVRVYNKITYQRALLYGAGLTKVMKKHNYSILSLIKVIVKPLLGSILFFIKGDFRKSKFYFKSFEGRLKGLVLNGN